MVDPKVLSVVNERKINDAEHVELLGAINVRYSDRYIVHNAPRGRDLREIEFLSVPRRVVSEGDD